MLKNRMLADTAEGMIAKYYYLKSKVSGSIVVIDFKKWVKRLATDGQFNNKFVIPYRVKKGLDTLATREEVVQMCEKLQDYFLGEDEVWVNEEGVREVHQKVLFDYQLFGVNSNDELPLMIFLVHENILTDVQVNALKDLLNLDIDVSVHDSIKLLK